MKIALFGDSKPVAYRRVASVLDAMDGVTVVDAGSTLSPDVAMVISIGGDGTFLRAAAVVGDAGIPILGVNAGRLGFLADVSLDEVETALPAMIAGGTHSVERRANIRVAINDGATLHGAWSALNEVAILKHEQSSMVSVSVCADGVMLNRYDADGLVVATPTGSTAYAMSAGGPILEPRCGCLALVPIAPHSLTTRPLVIRDSTTLDIHVASRNGRYLVAVDGQPVHLTTRHTLHVTRAAHDTLIVRRPDRSFFDTMRQKFMWGMDARAEE